MYISESTRKAYTEVDNFIELLDEYHKNKIPKKLREFFKNENTVNELNSIMAGKEKVVFELPNEYFPNLEDEEKED